MNIIKNKCLIFFESIPANLVINFLASVAIFFLVQHKTALFAIPFLLITNTLWIIFYLMFTYSGDWQIFSISNKGKFLIAYLSLFFILTCFFWLPHTSRKMYITLIFSINALFLFAFIFYRLFKNALVKKINTSNSALWNNKILMRLQSIISNGESDNDNYYSIVNISQGNLENIFTYNSKKFLSISRLSKKRKNVANKQPEMAPYTFAEISVGDTLADWLISTSIRDSNVSKVRKLSNRILKRGLDIFISLIVIVFFLSWMVPIIGLLIKFESRGPIFFKQLRSGLNNQPFWCIKFRSMYVNEKSDEVQASRNDNRITKVGLFLRKTSIDEFPQFINVLKGEMSIVGPRPHMLLHTEIYGKQIKNYMDRLSLKQGLTGFAQVKGFRGETADIKWMESRVEHDLWYAENWSLWLDIKIIFLTIIKIFNTDENAF